MAFFVVSLACPIVNLHGINLLLAYIEAHDFESRREVNARLLRTAIEAISGIAPNLESFILQTGGKGYGLEFSNELKISPPLRCFRDSNIVAHIQCPTAPPG